MHLASTRLPTQVDFPSQSLDLPGHLSTVRSCRVPVSLGASEVTLEFRSVTASVVGTNSPLLVMLVDYVVNWYSMSVDYKVLMLCYGVVYLTDMCTIRDHLTDIYASFEITRLICVSFGIPRLICVSFGIPRLICVRVQRGADGRGARRMREGHMDASGFLYASADVFCYSLFSLSDRVIVRIFGKCRQGEVHVRVAEEAEEGAGRVQPRVQHVAQATDPATPITYADLAAMEQRFKDLIMQMRELQQPAPPAPAPVPVMPQVVPDQLSTEAKHLRDFRKYNPTTFDGCLEDPPGLRFDRGTAWWETAERMLGGDVGQITWGQFKESFYAKFFSASLRDTKRQEFLNL
ncbi:gag protease polyprotein [Cucumis melo var. makuwa]|uniref:Gag protease polyprotein n=1 Tax=Cucumis melo var. makuwa TaxID=1194695 RepID=A0A5D3E138_CUCMM|nr:gag protease polyprotein [Cucumis melo var. makuwa]